MHAGHWRLRRSGCGAVGAAATGGSFFAPIIRQAVGMPLNMRLHLLFVFEGVVADGALVALGAVVLHAVQLQHVVVAELTLTDVAAVGLLAGVRA